MEFGSIHFVVMFSYRCRVGVFSCRFAAAAVVIGGVAKVAIVYFWYMVLFMVGSVAVVAEAGFAAKVVMLGCYS